jgi:hypothetical protein
MRKSFSNSVMMKTADRTNLHWILRATAYLHIVLNRWRRQIDLAISFRSRSVPIPITNGGFMVRGCRCAFALEAPARSYLYGGAGVLPGASRTAGRQAGHYVPRQARARRSARGRGCQHAHASFEVKRYWFTVATSHRKQAKTKLKLEEFPPNERPVSKHRR